MYWIELITDPKILKLGIRMALYREKKPEEDDYFESMPDQFESDMIKWREQSRIAYLKEPEFKVGEKVYEISTGAYAGDVCVVWMDLVITTKGRFKEDEISHYCPGQEYDGDIKYVEEKANCPECNASLNYEKNTEFWECPQCLEIEGNRERYHFFELNIEWQEVEEPEEEILKIDPSDPLGEGIKWNHNNPKYTQFQEGINEAKIVAELTKY